MLRIAFPCICLVMAAALGGCSRASAPLGFGYGTQSTDQLSSGIRKRLFAKKDDDKPSKQVSDKKASKEDAPAKSATAKKAPAASAPVETAKTPDKKPAPAIVKHETKDAMAKKDKMAMKYAMAETDAMTKKEPMADKTAIAKTDAMNKENGIAVADATDTSLAVKTGQRSKPVRTAKLTPKPNTTPAASIKSGLPQIDVIAVRDMVNAYRKKNGMKPLALHPQLAKAAALHSKDLANLDKISHFGSDGSNPWQRVERTGYKPKLAAENVGTGQQNFREVLKGWMESPSHNENLLLPDAKHMGVALIHDSKSHNKTFWTLVLGSTL